MAHVPPRERGNLVAAAAFARQLGGRNVVAYNTAYEYVFMRMWMDAPGKRLRLVGFNPSHGANVTIAPHDDADVVVTQVLGGGVAPPVLRNESSGADYPLARTYPPFAVYVAPRDLPGR